MDLHSVTPTGEPSSNSRGQSSGEPKLTNAEVLSISITILITCLFAVQSLARWYTKESDYSLIDLGVAALAALAQLSSRLKQNNNRSGLLAVVSAAMDDLEAGEQVRFVEVQGFHWHSHSDALVDGKASPPTTPINHDPHVPSRVLSRSSDASAMEELVSASQEALPEVVTRRGSWGSTPSREERHGAALPSQGELQIEGGGEDCVRESQAPVMVIAGATSSREAFWSSSEEDDNSLSGEARDERQGMHVELASMHSVDRDIPATYEDIPTAGGGVRGGGGRSWQDRTDEEILSGGILIPWDNDDSDMTSSDNTSDEK